jgi:hypothetical protein
MRGVELMDLRHIERIQETLQQHLQAEVTSPEQYQAVLDLVAGDGDVSFLTQPPPVQRPGLPATSELNPGALLPGAKKPRRRKGELKVVVPKKPKTAYNYYQLSVHDALKVEVAGTARPDDTKEERSHQVARLTGQRWKALSAAEKAPFQRQATSDKVRFERDKRDTGSVGGKQVLSDS